MNHSCTFQSVPTGTLIDTFNILVRNYSNMFSITNALERIAGTFAATKKQGRAALMPYYTLGYPNRDASLDIIEAIAPLSDLLELGVPFSDPIADGPTIQRSTQTALDRGVDTTTCLSSVRQLRAEGVDTPILLMGYYNSILAHDEKQYVYDAAEAGVDGFIVPDLPPEEAGPLAGAHLERPG